MKVRILSRKKLDGKMIRVLSCGHEQIETSGGKAHLFMDAHCRACGPTSPSVVKPISEPSTSKTRVAVRCSVPTQHADNLKARCLTCHEWVCGQCEGSNLRVGSRAVPCDKCWLKAEGITTQVARVTKPLPIAAVIAPRVVTEEAPLTLPIGVQPAV